MQNSSSISFGTTTQTLKVGSSATVTISGPIYLDSPNFPAWTQYTYNAGDFTGAGSMTWTVATASVANISYAIAGKWMAITIGVIQSSVGGTVASSLQFTIPGGKLSKTRADGTCIVTDNGTVGLGRIGCNIPSSSVIVFQKPDGSNFITSTTNTSVRGFLLFEIQ